MLKCALVLIKHAIRTEIRAKASYCRLTMIAFLNYQLIKCQDFIFRPEKVCYCLRMLLSGRWHRININLRKSSAYSHMDIRTAPVAKTRSGVDIITVKIQKAENKIATQSWFYRQAIAKLSMLALQNAPIWAFCKSRILHLAITCGENTTNHILKFWFSEVSLYFDII